MKKYKLKQLLACILLLSLPATAAELEGVKLADSLRFNEGGPELVLNGAGLRTRFFFRVYVGALYVTARSGSAQALIDNPGPKRMVLHLLRDLGAAQLFDALDEGLRKNHAEEELRRLEPRIQRLRAVFEAVKGGRSGDVVHIDWLPGTGTRIAINGAEKDVIAGEDFHRALLRIWLGERPADNDLKRGLLGG